MTIAGIKAGEGEKGEKVVTDLLEKGGFRSSGEDGIKDVTSVKKEMDREVVSPFLCKRRASELALTS